MDDVINITENTVLLNREYYEEFVKKNTKLVKNNKSRGNRIKNLKKVVNDCQIANKKNKAKIKELKQEIKEITSIKDKYMEVVWDKFCDNQVLHNELDMAIEQGYVASEAFKNYMNQMMEKPDLLNEDYEEL